jgi:hypothetical protein
MRRSIDQAIAPALLRIVRRVIVRQALIRVIVLPLTGQFIGRP